MWWDPTQADFTSALGSLFDGFGTLSTQKYALFNNLCSSLSSRVQKSLKTVQKPNDTLWSLVKSMEHACSRLEWCSGSYLEMRFSVTELQRYYLEVLALVDFIEIYKPR